MITKTERRNHSKVPMARVVQRTQKHFKRTRILAFCAEFVSSTNVNLTLRRRYLFEYFSLVQY